MTKAVFGKSSENQPKRTVIQLFNERQASAKLVEKPHSVDARILSHKEVCIAMQNLMLLLSKPSYVGFAVFELTYLHILRNVHSLITPLHLNANKYIQYIFITGLWLNVYRTQSGFPTL